jgi:hypothetical protein
MPKAEPELTAICEALQIDVRTLRNWRKRDGFPHGEDAAAVKLWADRNGLGRLKDSTLSELKAELMREQIRLARAKNEREAGDVIDRDVVEAMLVTLGQKLDLLLRLKLEVELGPRVAGKSAAEANVEGGEILAEIRDVINSNVAKFEGEALAKSRAAEVET